jgi:hypothetical protein
VLTIYRLQVSRDAKLFEAAELILTKIFPLLSKVQTFRKNLSKK